jgi:hypothetical protein
MDQVAFEGSAIGSLDKLRRILIEVEGFDWVNNDFGLGNTIRPLGGITIADDLWRPSVLFACLVAAHFKRRFLPERGNVPSQGFRIIGRAEYQAWVDEAITIFAPAGLLSNDEAREEDLARDDFWPYINYGDRFLARRTGQDDAEIAQGITVVLRTRAR